MITPKSSYIGHHADLYDLFYHDKPYQEEATFIHNCLTKYGTNTKTILELACGTGTHSLLLEKLGYEITATDYSVDMIKQAKNKGKALNSQVKFFLKDMRELEQPEHPWDAVICLFDSIGYVATNEDLLKVLLGIRLQLESGGIFIFEFWHAGALLKSYDPLRLRRFKLSDGEILRISETSIDYDSQTCAVKYTILELKNTGKFNQIEETQINRFFLIQEMANLLNCADFLPLKWFSGYTTDEIINSSTWHIVCAARAGQKG